jgi:uncharacterized protein (DUF1697 family)
MHTSISILRGINVSGHNLIKMSALREMYENMGFYNIRTYIQSGNVVFDHETEDAGQLCEMISKGINKRFGFDVPVIVIGKDELKIISGQNLFINERGEDISKLHVTFLSREPDGKMAENISPAEYLPDEFFIIGRSIFLFCPNGYGNTKLSNAFFEKKLKVQATTRNWKTVLELVNISHC